VWNAAELTEAQKKANQISIIGLILMVIGSIGLDQISKIHAEGTRMVWQDETNLKQYQGQRHQVVTIGEPTANPRSSELYFSFSFNYVRNFGAAWGLLGSMPDEIRIPFFYAVTIIAVIILGMYMRATPPSHRLVRFGLCLILSGAIGNFIDRLRIGYVIDFLDFRWNISGMRYSFPNFNIADIAICVGVAILAVDMFVLDFLRRRRTRQRIAAKIYNAK
jgi:signal peptidase II